MIFVSYSWSDEKPNQKILELVSDLRILGFDATCDIMYMQVESSLHFNEMMADNLHKAEKVIIILSESYKQKADLFKGGVGSEYRYIINDIQSNKNKYILVSFSKDYNLVTPDFLRGREIIFIEDKEDKYEKLIYKISDTPEYIFPSVSSKKIQVKSKVIKTSLKKK